MSHTNLIQTNIHFERVAGVTGVEHMLVKSAVVSTLRASACWVFNSLAPGGSTHAHVYTRM